VSDEMRERELLSKSREVLDASVEAIDPATRTRLRAARARAIEAASRRSRSRWLPAAGLVAAASAALLAIALWRAEAPDRTGEPITEVPAPIATAPVEPVPLAAAEDLDLYLDLDFFTWLAEEADAG
jgi:hypothetical protein